MLQCQAVSNMLMQLTGVSLNVIRKIERCPQILPGS
jgi:hypothetical protein